MVIETLEKTTTSRKERRRKAVGAILDGIEADGLQGLFTAVGRMIGENQPSIDCVREAEGAFGPGATSGGFSEDDTLEDIEGSIFGDNVWDSALDFAACLRNAELEPVEPDPVEPTDPHPDPPPPPPWDLKDNVADIVLAGLLVRLKNG
ncbi:hypothetical protein [Sphingomonas sp.]|uniref:hypothetical protein n=1 Tax=Sphingomonas sp. TaxID=28214 RepID=UPI0025F507F9|nr:hypothetical protein [Sphingomonas sp.]